MMTSGERQFEREVGAARVRHYLRSLKWDGVFWIDGLSAQPAFGHPAKASEALWQFFTDAVRRAFEPGCTIDRTLVLAGPNGVGKSRLLQTLAGGSYWACTATRSDVMVSADSLRGEPWILEVVVEGRRALTSHVVKSLICTTADDTVGQVVDRSFLPVISTNDSLWFEDFAKSRRLYVLPVTQPVQIDAGLRDRLWAEAYARYEGGK